MPDESIQPAAPPPTPSAEPSAPTPPETSPTPTTPADGAPTDLGFTFDKLSLPEGSEILPEQSARFMEVLADSKLSHQDRAQALVDLQGQVLEQAAQKIAAQWTAQQQAWQDEVKADPAFAGDKLAPALGQISRLIDAHGTEELRTAMDQTGMGNHPAMIRFLHKLSGFLTEGGALPGGNAPAQEKTQAQRIFTTMQ